MAGGQSIFGMWYRGYNDVVSFGIRTPGIKRNIHTTIFQDAGALYCEVSDYLDGTKESKEQVWLSPNPLILADADAIFEKAVEGMVQDYDEDDEYDEIGAPFGRFVDDIDFEARNVAEFDLIPLLKGISSGNLFNRRSILDSYQDEMFGISREGNSVQLVMPITESQLFQFDISPNNPLFSQLPFFEGVERMFEHMGSAGVLDDYYRLHPPDINKIQAAIMGVLSQNAGSSVTQPPTPQPRAPPA